MISNKLQVLISILSLSKFLIAEAGNLDKSTSVKTNEQILLEGDSKSIGNKYPLNQLELEPASSAIFSRSFSLLRTTTTGPGKELVVDSSADKNEQEHKRRKRTAAEEEYDTINSDFYEANPLKLEFSKDNDATVYQKVTVGTENIHLEDEKKIQVPQRIIALQDDANAERVLRNKSPNPDVASTETFSSHEKNSQETMASLETQIGDFFRNEQEFSAPTKISAVVNSSQKTQTIELNSENQSAKKFLHAGNMGDDTYKLIRVKRIKRDEGGRKRVDGSVSAPPKPIHRGESVDREQLKNVIPKLELYTAPVKSHFSNNRPTTTTVKPKKHSRVGNEFSSVVRRDLPRVGHQFEKDTYGPSIGNFVAESKQILIKKPSPLQQPSAQQYSPANQQFFQQRQEQALNNLQKAPIHYTFSAPYLNDLAFTADYTPIGEQNRQQSGPYFHEQARIQPASFGNGPVNANEQKATYDNGQTFPYYPPVFNQEPFNQYNNNNPSNAQPPITQSPKQPDHLILPALIDIPAIEAPEAQFPAQFSHPQPQLQFPQRQNLAVAFPLQSQPQPRTQQEQQRIPGKPKSNQQQTTFQLNLQNQRIIAPRAKPIPRPPIQPEIGRGGFNREHFHKGSDKVEVVDNDIAPPLYKTSEKLTQNKLHSTKAPTTVNNGTPPTKRLSTIRDSSTNINARQAAELESDFEAPTNQTTPPITTNSQLFTTSISTIASKQFVTNSSTLVRTSLADQQHIDLTTPSIKTQSESIITDETTKLEKQSNGNRDEVSVGFSKNGAREVVEHETVYDASIDVDVPPASTATEPTTDERSTRDIKPTRR